MGGSYSTFLGDEKHIEYLCEESLDRDGRIILKRI
jgi:hypothetical protein